MIVGTGIDLVDIARLEEVILRRGERFCARVFTDAEINYCEKRTGAARSASYAARFAAKEAVMKALGTGWSEGVAWREIEVDIEPSGAPVIRLRGRALERFGELGGTRIHCSLSHAGNLAAAQVVFES
jgi:holo-[acyl-carrier protein] synthase